MIVKQPNGLYAVFSTVVDNFVAYDATPEEIIDLFVKDYREDLERTIPRLIESAEFERTWEECIEIIKDQGHELPKIRSVR